MFALINPKASDKRQNSFPLGLSYIAASFEKYGEVRVFDLDYKSF